MGAANQTVTGSAIPTEGGETGKPGAQALKITQLHLLTQSKFRNLRRFNMSLPLNMSGYAPYCTIEGTE